MEIRQHQENIEEKPRNKQKKFIFKVGPIEIKEFMVIELSIRAIKVQKTTFFYIGHNPELLS